MKNALVLAIAVAEMTFQGHPRSSKNIRENIRVIY